MREITISIPDEHYEVLVQQAAKARRTPEDEAGIIVEQYLSMPTPYGSALHPLISHP